MAKVKTIYKCSACGATYSRWQGQCNECQEWNTIEEQLVQPTTASGRTTPAQDIQRKLTQIQEKAGWDGLHSEEIRPIQQIVGSEESRIDLHDEELNRLLGGGLVQGSFTLLGGEPGIGKSTLIFQTVLRCPELKTLYVSGEESAQQLKLRADRIGIHSEQCLIYCDTDLDNILLKALQIAPDLLVIDSIQTVTTARSDSSPGSISQIKECANLLLHFAKSSGIPVIVIGHINKEGSIAGPKILEHTVDTVLQFEGDKQHLYRILRSHKNRFGSTDDLGIYEMNSSGLVAVSNPSEHLISGNTEGLSGVVVACAVEGIRPIMIETQALVSSAIYNNPQRSTTGFDLRRLNMLLAVLEKRAGFKLIQKDVFLNITGGIKINDTAVDLAVLCAVLSSNLDIAVPSKTCMTGEVGLAGEIRAVSRIERRIAEAHRLGFTRILIPKANAKSLQQRNYDIEIVPCDRVDHAFRTLFSQRQ